MQPDYIPKDFPIRLDAVQEEDERLLPLVYPRIDQLAESIAKVGLLHPVVGYRKGSLSVHLLAGRHRLAACRKLGWETIPARVYELGPEHAELPEPLRRLVEIDENLIRGELSPAERALLTAERKAAYEALHPETKHGGDRRSSDQVDLLKADRFTKETARASGRSEPSVKRDAQRGKALGGSLRLIAGTSLDKGASIDRLAKMPARERKPLIERAAAGERVSLRKRADSTSVADQVGRLRRAWKDATVTARERFVFEHAEVIARIISKVGARKAKRAGK